MLELILPWVGILLGAVLLIRSVQTRLSWKYPLFFFYIGWVLVVSASRFYLISSHGDIYPQFYWPTEALTVIVGCGVILEGYRGVLRSYPGAQRIATTILLALLAIILVKAYSHPFGKPKDWLLSFSAEVERDTRTVQGILLVPLIAIVLYYSIPIGKNLLGIITGYAFFIGINIINLALQSTLGPSFWTPWRYLQSASYFVALLIWCITLWSRQPEPMPEVSRLGQLDYEVLASKTDNALSRVRGYIVRPFRK